MSDTPYPEPRSFEQVCDAEVSTLRHMLTRAQSYQRLSRHVAADLPALLSAHCRIACIRGETLVVAADSAAWATRAKLQGDLWLEAVRRYWPGSISQLTVRVQAPDIISAAEQQPRQLPAAVCEHLARCAHDQRDPAMADILQRLAQHRATRDDE